MPLASLLRHGASLAQACAVCFGKDDNPNLAKAFYIGGGLLLACTFALLGGAAYAIYRLEKARLKEDRRLGLLDEPQA